MVDYSLIIRRERQYKRKIKLWNLRKNANLGDYSHVDQLMQSPSTVPLGDVFMSQGIPITNNKIRRYMKHKGLKAPATTESHISTPPDGTGDHPVRSPKDDEATHNLSPSIDDEKDPKPDKRRPSSKLMELLAQLRQQEDHIAKLKVQIQGETARLSKRRHDVDKHRRDVDIRASQKTGEPQQAPAAPAAPAPPAVSAPPAASAAPPVPAPEILAVREANAKKEWRTVTIRDLQLQPYRQEPNPFEEAFKAAVKPGRPAAKPFALSVFDNNDDGFFSLLGFPRGDNDDAQPLAAPSGGKAKRTNILAKQFRALHPESMFAVPAIGGSKLGDVQNGALDLEPFLASWWTLPMSTSMPLRTGLTPGHSLMFTGPFL